MPFLHVYKRHMYSNTQANTVSKDGLTDRLARLKGHTVVKQGGFTYQMTSDVHHDQTSSGVNGTPPKKLLLWFPWTFLYHMTLLKVWTGAAQVTRRMLLSKHTSNDCQHSNYVLFSFHVSHFSLLDRLSIFFSSSLAQGTRYLVIMGQSDQTGFQVPLQLLQGKERKSSEAVLKLLPPFQREN